MSAKPRIAIVHVGDIHLRPQNRTVLTRVEAINRAVRAEASGCSVVFLAVTGDIAFSGSSVEYELAATLVSELIRAIASWAGAVPVLFIPGNHDCNFSKASSLRRIVLSQVDDVLGDIRDDRHEAAVECLRVQEDFFEFVNKTTGKFNGDRLHYSYRHEIDGASAIRFECLNTAWLSCEKEEQGQIRIAPCILERMLRSESENDFVVALMHHPFAWFDVSNRRMLEAKLQESADLVLTGHEHVADQYGRVRGESTVQYIGGGILQDDHGSSAFNLVLLNFEEQEQELIPFRWQEGLYRSGARTGRQFLSENAGAHGRRFQLSEEWGLHLNDPGRGFRHPRRPMGLRSRDLFVYPDLRQRSLERRLQGQTTGPTTIYSEQVVDRLLDLRRALIIGPAESGKTGMANALYMDFHSKGLLPVGIDAKDIDGHSQEALRRAVARSVAHQYRPSVVDEYLQLPSRRKALIIDDFHSFPFNTAGKTQLLREAEREFATVIIFADDLFRYEELSDTARELSPFVAYEHCEIRPLGFRLRHDLIHRWVALGQEYSIGERELRNEIERRERVIDNIIGRELIPAYPLTVLLILQAADIDPNQPITGGTYGYFNDVLINAALAKVKRRITDIQTLSTYLAHLAYFQFTQEAEDLTSAQLDKATHHYLEQYAMPFQASQILDDVLSAQILEQREDSIAFKYKHYYYYFLARYFRDHIAGRRATELRSQLDSIADNIYFDPYVTILTFYLYFYKDELLIDHLLCNSREIYAEHKPCDLDSHVAFLNLLYDKTPERFLPAPEPSRAQIEVLRDLDDRADATLHERLKPAKIRYSKELEDFLKVNIALKTLQVLGQVLKDSPGSLPAAIKADVAQECYSLGLRTLRAVLLMAEVNLPEFQAVIERLIKDRRSLDPEARVPKDANRFLIWLSLGAALGVIRRVSRAVGHTDLKRTYEEVLLRLKGMISVELIDLSIQLDHFHSVSVRTIEELVRHKLKDNIFGYQIVQDLVYSYFSLFPSERGERQRICSAAGIISEDPGFMGTRLKALPAAAGGQAEVAHRKKGGRRRGK